MRAFAVLSLLLLTSTAWADEETGDLRNVSKG